MLSRGWDKFRAAPLWAQGLAWGVTGVALALVVLSLDSEPVPDESGVIVATPGPQTFVQTTPTQPGNRDLPEDPRKKDPQLPAGAVPEEIGEYEVPDDFRATDEQVTELFNATLGGRGRVGQNKNILVDVSCSDGECRIEYVPDGQGAGRIVETQGVIWRALLKDPGWLKGTMVVLPGGPDLVDPAGRPKENAPPEAAGPPILTVSCTRAQVEAVEEAFSVQGAPRVRQSCDVSDVDQPGR